MDANKNQRGILVFISLFPDRSNYGGVVSRSNKNNYTKVLAIKPAHHRGNGTAIAILDEETRTVNACDLLFAETQIELEEIARKFWESQTGDRCEPKALCIEYPHRFIGRSAFVVSYLCARIEKNFSPKIPFRPRSRTWEKNHNTPFTLSEYAKHQLASISNLQGNDIRDVIDMALWAAENLKHENN